MNGQKQQYLQSIRANSAYPTYRGIINTIALLGYIIAGLAGLSALIAGFGMMEGRTPGLGVLVLAGGSAIAFLYYLPAQFFKEAALILADLADSTVEARRSCRWSLSYVRGLRGRPRTSSREQTSLLR